jgi:hypothetical protein
LSHWTGARAPISAPGTTARPKSGQKKSGQDEPGSAWRAITGKKVAVMM